MKKTAVFILAGLLCLLGWTGAGDDGDKRSLTTMDFILSAKAEDNETEAAAAQVVGVYYPFAKMRDGWCIAMPEGLENGRFILHADGSAQSPMGEKVNAYTWVLDGESITFKDKDSGETVYNGTIAKGILTLDIIYTNPDGSTFTTQDILATKDADTSGFDTITIEEYNALPRDQKNS